MMALTILEITGLACIAIGGFAMYRHGVVLNVVYRFIDDHNVDGLLRKLPPQAAMAEDLKYLHLWTYEQWLEWVKRKEEQ